MKKIFLLSALTFSIISCSSDANLDNEKEYSNETTMKLKEFNAITSSKYFYHENGFLDSISIIGGGMNTTNVQSKFYYDSENKLDSVYRWIKPTSPENLIFEKDIFEYNDQSLIETKKIFDENNNLKRSLSYSYNSEGYLDISNDTYLNGNLIKSGGITYTFDDKRNPFYEMYPLAYVRMNQINKNNETSFSIGLETLGITNWSYNQNGYPISFQKNPVLPDDIDFAEYIYY